MSDPGKQERTEDFLRRSLLGEELVNTQFHLFSARSSPSGRVIKPRVLCANNALLAKSSKYFLDLLSADINASDLSLTDLTGDNDVPSNAHIDDYGYGSDSDLDDCNDLPPVAGTTTRKVRPGALSTKSSRISPTKSKVDDESSESDSESDDSDIFVTSPEQPRTDEFSMNKDGSGSVASSETAVQGSQDKETLASQTAMRLRSLGSRHVLVKDTAFQTWYTLLNYLYTNKFNFLPLGSATPCGQPHESSTSSLDEPRCSAKSMYRLACKVGLDDLSGEAFSYIRRNLTEHNILKELSCSLLSKHPRLLEMELDVLYSHIGSTPVVTNFSALAQRIANKEFAHGADIIIGVHTRLLKEPHPLPLRPAIPSPLSSIRGHPGPVKVEVVERSDTPGIETEDETDLSPRTEKQNAPSGSPVSACGSGVPGIDIKLQGYLNTPLPTAPSSKQPKAGEKGAAPPPQPSAVNRETVPRATSAFGSPQHPSLFASMTGEASKEAVRPSTSVFGSPSNFSKPARTANPPPFAFRSK